MYAYTCIYDGGRDRNVAYAYAKGNQTAIDLVNQVSLSLSLFLSLSLSRARSLSLSL